MSGHQTAGALWRSRLSLGARRASAAASTPPESGGEAEALADVTWQHNSGHQPPSDHREKAASAWHGSQNESQPAAGHAALPATAAAAGGAMDVPDSDNEMPCFDILGEAGPPAGGHASLLQQQGQVQQQQQQQELGDLAGPSSHWPRAELEEGKTRGAAQEGSILGRERCLAPAAVEQRQPPPQQQQQQQPEEDRWDSPVRAQPGPTGPAADKAPAEGDGDAQPTTTRSRPTTGRRRLQLKRLFGDEDSGQQQQEQQQGQHEAAAGGRAQLGSRQAAAAAAESLPAAARMGQAGSDSESDPDLRWSKRQPAAATAPLGAAANAAFAVRGLRRLRRAGEGSMKQQRQVAGEPGLQQRSPQPQAQQQQPQAEPMQSPAHPRSVQRGRLSLTASRPAAVDGTSTALADPAGPGAAKRSTNPFVRPAATANITRVMLAPNWPAGGAAAGGVTTDMMASLFDSTAQLAPPRQQQQPQPTGEQRLGGVKQGSRYHNKIVQQQQQQRETVPRRPCLGSDSDDDFEPAPSHRAGSAGKQQQQQRPTCQAGMQRSPQQQRQQWQQGALLQQQPQQQWQQQQRPQGEGPKVISLLSQGDGRADGGPQHGSGQGGTGPPAAAAAGPGGGGSSRGGAGQPGVVMFWQAPEEEEEHGGEGLGWQEEGHWGQQQWQQERQQEPWAGPGGWGPPGREDDPAGPSTRQEWGATGALLGGARDGSQGGDAQPWWHRFPDFVPVDGLAGGRNPRDGSQVFIDYKRQFSGQSGGGSTTAAASAARAEARQAGGGASRGTGGSSRGRPGVTTPGGSAAQGHWDHEGSRKVYINKRGKTLFGQIAYLEYLKETGRTGGKARSSRGGGQGGSQAVGGRGRKRKRSKKGGGGGRKSKK